MFKEKLLGNDRSSYDEDAITILDKDCTFEGKLTFDGTVQIFGQFKGEIFSAGTLMVGDSALIEGKIEVGILKASGKIRGKIVVKERLELLSQAQVLADVATPSLLVEQGAQFQGNCQMGVSIEETQFRTALASYTKPESSLRSPSEPGGANNNIEEIELFQ